MLKNLLDICGSSIAFYFVGYAFAFGGDPEKRSFIGTSNFFLQDLGDDATGIGYAHWLFQFAFAATAATIVAGTLAERCQMNAYLLYSMVLTGFVYPVIVHNIWFQGGFLNAFRSKPLLGVGMIDFAGSGVVHVTGGFTALIATHLLGPRKGRFYDERGKKLKEPKAFPGHSRSLQMLGTFILWFGWYGFNSGSAIKIDADLRPSVISRTVVNTTLAGSASAITALLANVIYNERKTGEPLYKLSAAMNGCLAGLASITGSCGVIEPWAAIVIGAVSGLLYLGTSYILIKRCIDDAVDAIPVHLGGGMWGVIATGLFASPRGLANYFGTESKHVGLFYSWGRNSPDASLLACQLIGLLFILVWISVIMVPFFIVLNYFGIFRSDGLEEVVGLDISYHGWTPDSVAEEVSQEQLTAYYTLKSNRSGGRRSPARDSEEDPDDDGVDRFE
eukprot:CAMPEP_0194076016 /NCGR_PEP_ID=MMETSP0149-20130528/2895_1 /TAXON_ID=122233 /ORGANISM="Chaetoceros debilis, Strain MM31A-1" /LENGTH=446 /DNA_ID=CAMNT_0038756653 /DNA_START=211 /DNA_END=1551 /DNA_ORIENTATION=-